MATTTPTDEELRIEYKIGTKDIPSCRKIWAEFYSNAISDSLKTGIYNNIQINDFFTNTSTYRTYSQYDRSNRITDSRMNWRQRFNRDMNAINIGTVELSVPIPDISMVDNKDVKLIDTIRTPGPSAIRKANEQIQYSISITFPDEDAINTKFRLLMAQTIVSPIIPIRSRFLTSLSIPFNSNSSIYYENALNLTKKFADNNKPTPEEFDKLYRDIAPLYSIDNMQVSPIPDQINAIIAVITITLVDQSIYTKDGSPKYLKDDQGVIDQALWNRNRYVYNKAKSKPLNKIFKDFGESLFNVNEVVRLATSTGPTQAMLGLTKNNFEKGIEKYLFYNRTNNSFATFAKLANKTPYSTASSLRKKSAASFFGFNHTTNIREIPAMYSASIHSPTWELSAGNSSRYVKRTENTYYVGDIFLNMNSRSLLNKFSLMDLQTVNDAILKKEVKVQGDKFGKKTNPNVYYAWLSLRNSSIQTNYLSDQLITTDPSKLTLNNDFVPLLGTDANTTDRRISAFKSITIPYNDMSGLSHMGKYGFGNHSTRYRFFVGLGTIFNHVGAEAESMHQEWNEGSKKRYVVVPDRNHPQYKYANDSLWNFWPGTNISNRFPQEKVPVSIYNLKYVIPYIPKSKKYGFLALSDIMKSRFSAARTKDKETNTPYSTPILDFLDKFWDWLKINVTKKNLDNYLEGNSSHILNKNIDDKILAAADILRIANFVYIDQDLASTGNRIASTLGKNKLFGTQTSRVSLLGILTNYYTHSKIGSAKNVITQSKHIKLFGDAFKYWHERSEFILKEMKNNKITNARPNPYSNNDSAVIGNINIPDTEINPIKVARTTRHIEESLPYLKYVRSILSEYKDAAESGKTQASHSVYRINPSYRTVLEKYKPNNNHITLWYKTLSRDLKNVILLDKTKDSPSKVGPNNKITTQELIGIQKLTGSLPVRKIDLSKSLINYVKQKITADVDAALNARKLRRPNQKGIIYLLLDYIFKLPNEPEYSDDRSRFVEKDGTFNSTAYHSLKGRRLIAHLVTMTLGLTENDLKRSGLSNAKTTRRDRYFTELANILYYGQAVPPTLNEKTKPNKSMSDITIGGTTFTRVQDVRDYLGSILTTTGFVSTKKVKYVDPIQQMIVYIHKRLISGDRGVQSIMKKINRHFKTIKSQKDERYKSLKKYVELYNEKYTKISSRGKSFIAPQNLRSYLEQARDEYKALEKMSPAQVIKQSCDGYSNMIVTAFGIEAQDSLLTRADLIQIKEYVDSVNAITSTINGMIYRSPFKWAELHIADKFEETTISEYKISRANDNVHIFREGNANPAVQNFGGGQVNIDLVITTRDMSLALNIASAAVEMEIPLRRSIMMDHHTPFLGNARGKSDFNKLMKITEKYFSTLSNASATGPASFDIPLIIHNNIANMMGIQHCVISNISFSTIPEAPGHLQISMSMLGTNASLKEFETPRYEVPRFDTTPIYDLFTSLGGNKSTKGLDKYINGIEMINSTMFGGFLFLEYMNVLASYLYMHSTSKVSHVSSNKEVNSKTLTSVEKKLGFTIHGRSYSKLGTNATGLGKLRYSHSKLAVIAYTNVMYMLSRMLSVNAHRKQDYIDSFQKNVKESIKLITGLNTASILSKSTIIDTLKNKFERDTEEDFELYKITGDRLIAANDKIGFATHILETLRNRYVIDQFGSDSSEVYAINKALSDISNNSLDNISDGFVKFISSLDPLITTSNIKVKEISSKAEDLLTSIFKSKNSNTNNIKVKWEDWYKIIKKDSVIDIVDVNNINYSIDRAIKSLDGGLLKFVERTRRDPITGLPSFGPKSVSVMIDAINEDGLFQNISKWARRMGVETKFHIDSEEVADGMTMLTKLIYNQLNSSGLPIFSVYDDFFKHKNNLSSEVAHNLAVFGITKSTFSNIEKLVTTFKQSDTDTKLSINTFKHIDNLQVPFAESDFTVKSEPLPANRSVYSVSLPKKHKDELIDIAKAARFLCYYSDIAIRKTTRMSIRHTGNRYYYMIPAPEVIRRAIAIVRQSDYLDEGTFSKKYKADFKHTSMTDIRRKPRTLHSTKGKDIQGSLRVERLRNFAFSYVKGIDSYAEIKFDEHIIPMIKSARIIIDNIQDFYRDAASVHEYIFNGISGDKKVHISNKDVMTIMKSSIDETYLPQTRNKILEEKTLAFSKSPSTTHNIYDDITLLPKASFNTITNLKQNTSALSRSFAKTKLDTVSKIQNTQNEHINNLKKVINKYTEIDTKIGLTRRWATDDSILNKWMTIIETTYSENIKNILSASANVSTSGINNDFINNQTFFRILLLLAIPGANGSPLELTTNKDSDVLAEYIGSLKYPKTNNVFSTTMTSRFADPGVNTDVNVSGIVKDLVVGAAIIATAISVAAGIGSIATLGMNVISGQGGMLAVSLILKTVGLGLDIETIRRLSDDTDTTDAIGILALIAGGRMLKGAGRATGIWGGARGVLKRSSTTSILKASKFLKKKMAVGALQNFKKYTGAETGIGSIVSLLVKKNLQALTLMVAGSEAIKILRDIFGTKMGLIGKYMHRYPFTMGYLLKERMLTAYVESEFLPAVSQGLMVVPTDIMGHIMIETSGWKDMLNKFFDLKSTYKDLPVPVFLERHLDTSKYFNKVKEKLLRSKNGSKTINPKVEQMRKQTIFQHMLAFIDPTFYIWRAGPVTEKERANMKTVTKRSGDNLRESSPDKIQQLGNVILEQTAKLELDISTFHYYARAFATQVASYSNGSESKKDEIEQHILKALGTSELIVVSATKEDTGSIGKIIKGIKNRINVLAGVLDFNIGLSSFTRKAGDYARKAGRDNYRKFLDLLTERGRINQKIKILKKIYDTIVFGATDETITDLFYTLMRPYEGAYTDKSFQLLQSRYEEAIRTATRRDVTNIPAAAFPAFKLYIIEEDNKSLLMFNDFYSYASVKSIDVYSSRKSASDTAVIVVTNVYGNLTNIHSADTNTENPFFGPVVANENVNSIMLKPGAMIQIRMGYRAILGEEEIVFTGEITDICGEELLTITCQGHGSQLTQIIGAGKGVTFGGLISTINKKTYKIQNLIWSILNEADDIGRLGGKTPFGNKDEILHDNAHSVFETATRSLMSSGLSALAGENYGRIFGEIIDTKMRNIIISERNPGFFDFLIMSKWLIYNESIWDSLQDLVLQYPNTVCTTRPYDDEATLIIAKRDDYYQYTDVSLGDNLQINATIKKLRRIVADNALAVQFIYEQLMKNAGEPSEIVILYLVTLFEVQHMYGNFTKSGGVTNESLEKYKESIEKMRTSGDWETQKELIKSKLNDPNSTTRSEIMNAFYEIFSKMHRFTNSVSNIDDYGDAKELTKRYIENELNSQRIQKGKTIKNVKDITKVRVIEGIYFVHADIAALTISFVLDRCLAASPQHKKISEIHFKQSANTIIKNDIKLMTGYNRVELSFISKNLLANLLNGVSGSLFNLGGASVRNINNPSSHNKIEISASPSIAASHIRTYSTFQKNAAIREHAFTEKKYAVANNILGNLMKDYYGGTFVVMGDPYIKPWDRIYLQDTKKDMWGIIGVEDVHQSFSKETGWITTITPDLEVNTRFNPEKGFGTLAEVISLALSGVETVLKLWAGVSTLKFIGRLGIKTIAKHSTKKAVDKGIKSIFRGGKWMKSINKSTISQFSGDLLKISNLKIGGIAKVALYTVGTAISLKLASSFPMPFKFITMKMGEFMNNQPITCIPLTYKGQSYISNLEGIKKDDRDLGPLAAIQKRIDVGISDIWSQFLYLPQHLINDVNNFKRVTSYASRINVTGD